MPFDERFVQAPQKFGPVDATASPAAKNLPPYDKAKGIPTTIDSNMTHWMRLEQFKFFSGTIS